VVWKSERLFRTAPTAFEVQDVDGEGNREVGLRIGSTDRQAGSRTFDGLFREQLRMFSVDRVSELAQPAGPFLQRFEIKPADSPELIKVLEAVARSRFLQQGTVVDFESPEFSVERWHQRERN